MFWARTTTLQPGNHIFVDTSALDKFLSTTVVLKQWRRLDG